MKKCPVCKGKGEIEKPNNRDGVVEKRTMAKLLKKEGYSHRQIMKFLGYASPHSVTHLLKS